MGSELVVRIADLATSHGITVGAAESLTCGSVVHELGSGPEAADWLRGGIVAYAPEVKYDVLGVTPGPLVSDRCAREMAAGAGRLLGADLTVATTGVGGPEPDEGEPAGVVYIATWTAQRTTCRRHEFSTDDPGEVLEATTEAALSMLVEALAPPARTP